MMKVRGSQVGANSWLEPAMLGTGQRKLALGGQQGVGNKEGPSSV